MEEETASWSSEDSKTPLWKLDVEGEGGGACPVS